MARTKQTARRSFPYIPPSVDNQPTLVEIYKTTQTRTISVDGQVELTAKPDIVDLSFSIRETGDTVDEAMSKALSKLAAARKGAAGNSNVSNEAISSDSVHVTEIEVEIPTDNKDNADDDDDDDEGDEDNAAAAAAAVAGARKRRKPTPGGFGGFGMSANNESSKSNRKYKKQQEVSIVLRIHLENETVAFFNKVMLEMTLLGLNSHSPPVYQSSTITELRQEVRKDAIQNAKLRANIILEGLNDENVSLGAPLTINEIQQDIKDDAEDSFYGSSSFYLGSRDRDGTLCSNAAVAEEESYSVKRARFESLESVIGDLFVLPDITVSAHVRVIFALNVSA